MEMDVSSLTRLDQTGPSNSLIKLWTMILVSVVEIHCSDSAVKTNVLCLFNLHFLMKGEKCDRVVSCEYALFLSPFKF